jgi:hypothetical protein
MTQQHSTTATPTQTERPDQNHQPKRPNRQPDNPNDRTSQTEKPDVHTHASRSDAEQNRQTRQRLSDLEVCWFVILEGGAGC